MHPTLQYRIARTLSSERVEAADRRSRSIAAAAGLDRHVRRDLHQRLMSPCRRLARRMIDPADLSTER